MDALAEGNPAATTAGAAPDWETLQKEIRCPLCGYNLRGLQQPRCPECGFTFSWDQLLHAERDRHPYLFEHQPRHNLRSLWKTYWTDCRPRRFWSQLSPVHPVKVRRLLLYWVLANVGLLVAVLASPSQQAWQLYRLTQLIRRSLVYVPSTGMYVRRGMPLSSGNYISPATVYAWAPPVLSWQFLRLCFTYKFENATDWAALTVMVWPWLTLAALLIFQASMRRVKIRMVHMLRLAIYGCDFSLLVVLAAVGASWVMDEHVLRLALLLCGGVGAYRLSFALQRYLRFDRPLLTALATQAIVLLAVFTAEVNLLPWGWM